MPGYRINERNIGDWALGGEPKRRRRRQSALPVPTLEERCALEKYSTCRQMLTAGHCHVNLLGTDLVKHWVSAGIARVESREFPDAPSAIRVREVVAISPDWLYGIELFSGLLKEMYQLDRFVNK